MNKKSENQTKLIKINSFYLILVCGIQIVII